MSTLNTYQIDEIAETEMNILRKMFLRKPLRWNVPLDIKGNIFSLIKEGEADIKRRMQFTQEESQYEIDHVLTEVTDSTLERIRELVEGTMLESEIFISEEFA